MKQLAHLFFLCCLLSFCNIHGAAEVQPEIVELLIPKLNSERIAYFFGNYGVEPINVASSPFKECRIANLHSVHNHQKIMRTLAVVDFQQPVHESLEQVHQHICQGQSVGLALRQAGWIIDKKPVYFGAISLSPQLQAWMQEDECDQAMVHIYQLHVFQDESKVPVHYCTIVEVHSPQYLDKNWLQALYYDQYDIFQQTPGEVKVILGSLQTLIQRFPYPFGKFQPN